TALFGAVLSARLTGELSSRLPGLGDRIPVDELTGSPAALAQLPDAVRTSVVEAFSVAITDVFTVAIPFGLAALVLVLVLPELPLRDTAHVGTGTDLA